MLTADIGGTNCWFSLWAANIRVDVVYDEIFTKVRSHVWIDLYEPLDPTLYHKV